jgi:MFS family permease
MPTVEQQVRSIKECEPSFPHGIKLLAWARAVRWAGWGFGEALIPVFIASFSQTFLQMGMFSSMVQIAALFSLPFIGLWADRVPAKQLVLLSLLLYPLVGINYFVAGTLKLAAFVVVARALNGFAWELENVGMETYYRRISHRARIAASFGYLDTWSNAAWICTALVGMVLVSRVPIQFLLLAITPFATISYFVVSRAPKDWVGDSKYGTNPSWLHSFRSTFTQWQTWHKDIKILTLLVLFCSIVNALTDFFIPIEAYLSGANLPMVVLLTVFGAVPALFGYQLGRLADKRNKYILLAIGLFTIAILLFGILVFPQYYYKLVVVFAMGVVVEMFDVVKSSLITTLGSAENYGIRGGAFESIATIGDLGAPLIIGVALDFFGLSGFLYLLAGLAVVFGGGYYLPRGIRRRDGPLTTSV